MKEAGMEWGLWNVRPGADQDGMRVMPVLGGYVLEGADNQPALFLADAQHHAWSVDVETMPESLRPKDVQPAGAVIHGTPMQTSFKSRVYLYNNGAYLAQSYEDSVMLRAFADKRVTVTVTEVPE